MQATISQLPEIARRVVSDLRTDLALSEGQIRRWYLPCAPSDLVTELLTLIHRSGEGAVEPVWIPATARAFTPSRVIIVRAPGLRTTPEGLRHLCGLAELRRLLNVPPPNWRIIRPSGAGGNEPDAVLAERGRRIAVEYDPGNYSRRKIAEKSRAFSELFEGQLWGVPYPARASLVKSIAPDAQVAVAPWT